MANELIINCTLPEIRIAMLEDGELQELLIEHSDDRGIVGNIYKGKVTRVLPGMQAAFVDIGLEKAAFLYVDDVFVHQETLSSGVNDEDEDEEDEDDDQDDQDEGDEGQLQAGDDEDDYPESDEAEGLEAGSSEILSAAPVEQIDAEEAAEDDLEPAGDFDPRHSDDGKGDEPRDEGDQPEESAGNFEASPPSDEAPVAAAPSPKGTVIIKASEGGAEAAAGKRPAAPKRGRGRRGGRGRDRERERPTTSTPRKETSVAYPKGYEDPIDTLESDRNSLSNREEGTTSIPRAAAERSKAGRRGEFRQRRDRSRRISSKRMERRPTVNIQDLLKEGQEVIVQAAKDPIAAKGARLTCHVSLPGRHLVCMPSVDHVGVSRRIEREDERRRLRDFVVRNRPPGMGFIVRTASGGKDPEHWIKQDMDYLATLWNDISKRSLEVKAPALIYEDLNPALRTVRDWVNEDVKKVIIDSKKDFEEVKSFVSHFMPDLQNRIECYQGDIPIFDAYGISTELHRSLERKVWLKSGGSIVIDQAEALVAIDVNTGRYVGKKNLEDTILKTNLEAVEEIAYQLRLRNCGGIIIIDLIDMEKDENRHRVYRALEEALKKDRARPTIVRLTELGLIEMTRKRIRDTLTRTLCESCATCEGKGFLKSKRTVAYEVLREIEREGIDRDVKKILIQAHPEVIDYLAFDEVHALDSLEKRFKKEIYLQAVDDFHQEQYELETDHTGTRKPITPKRQFKHRQPSRAYEPREESREENDSRGPKPARVAPLAPITPITPFLSGPLSSTPVVTAPVTKIAPLATPKVTVEVRPAEILEAREESMESGMDEEDRLAYLRAQAAQDAALATAGQGSGSSAMKQSNGQGHRGRNGPGGRRGESNNNNRRGGAGRGRNRFRTGPGGGGNGGRRPPGRSEGMGVRPRPLHQDDQDRQPVEVTSVPSDTGGSDPDRDTPGNS